MSEKKRKRGEKERKTRQAERERAKTRERQKKAHRPRLVSRKARPISPARFSSAAARTSDDGAAALGCWFCIFFCFCALRKMKRGRVSFSFLLRTVGRRRRRSFFLIPHSRWRAPLLLTSSPSLPPARRGSETGLLGASALQARRSTATAWPTTSRAPGKTGFE